MNAPADADPSARNAARLQGLFKGVDLPEITGVDFSKMSHAEIAGLLPFRLRRTKMAQWQLVDGSMPAEGPECFPTVTIQSEAHLREELNRLRNREPGIFVLESPDHDALQIGMGGPLSGLRRFRNQDAHSVVLADRPYSAKRVDFASEGDTLAFWPDELIPVEQAIEVILFFYKNRSLPDWIGWKEWDRDRSKWIIKPATAVRSA
jgi:hypothetical protein